MTTTVSYALPPALRACLERPHPGFSQAREKHVQDLRDLLAGCPVPPEGLGVAVQETTGRGVVEWALQQKMWWAIDALAQHGCPLPPQVNGRPALEYIIHARQKVWTHWVNEAQRTGQPPEGLDLALCLAVRAISPKAVKAFLALGADPQALSPYGTAPLHEWARVLPNQANHTAIAPLLTAAGALPGQYNSRGESACHLLCRAVRNTDWESTWKALPATPADWQAETADGKSCIRLVLDTFHHTVRKANAKPANLLHTMALSDVRNSLIGPCVFLMQQQVAVSSDDITYLRQSIADAPAPKGVQETLHAFAAAMEAATLEARLQVDLPSVPAARRVRL